MVRIEFDDFIKEVSAFFERTKAPTGKTMDLWYEEVRHIPKYALSGILAEIKTLESWPRNLPAFMRSKYSEFREKNGEDNPYKIHDRRFHPERYAKSNCPKCHGKGIYDFPMDWPVARKNGKLITRHVVRPALCPCTDNAEYPF